MKTAKAPKGLFAAGKRFWKKVLMECEFSEAHDFERLSMACKCLDTLAEAEKKVATDGLFSINRYGATVEHPGVKMIRDSRMLFVKIIRELNLDVPAPESRPPRKY